VRSVRCVAKAFARFQRKGRKPKAQGENAPGQHFAGHVLTEQSHTKPASTLGGFRVYL
jgi:hypothetical protein